MALVSFAAIARVFEPIAADDVKSAPASLYDTPEVFPVVHVRDFVVDGDPAKGLWRKAEPITAFTVKTGKGEPLKTEVRMMYSSKALYICGTMYQPMEKLTAQFDQDDLAVYNDDCVEILLNTPNEGDSDFHGDKSSRQDVGYEKRRFVVSCQGNEGKDAQAYRPLDV